jgi:hypothetical protein
VEFLYCTKLVIHNLLSLVVMECFMMIPRLTERCIEPITHGAINVDFWFPYAMLGRVATGDATPDVGVADPVKPDLEEESEVNRRSPSRHCVVGDPKKVSEADTC